MSEKIPEGLDASFAPQYTVVSQQFVNLEVVTRVLIHGQFEEFRAPRQMVEQGHALEDEVN